MSSAHRVATSVADGVATVTLDRPDKRNGLDLAMFEALVATGEWIAGDPSIRAVVLTGAGPAFCAGLDVQWFAANQAEARKLLERGDSPANLAQRAAWIWQEVPVPVIAAIRGAAFGGGLQIALGADLRIAGRDARLSVMEIHYGLVPDMSISQTLPRLMPADRAKDLVFTGRIVEAEEALALGLVTRIADDPDAEAESLAAEIASRSPHAIRAAKALLGAAADLDLADALRLETDLQLGLLGSRNQLEAVTARLTRREPSFEDVG
jgi:enoyl-CoA hydratase/carnithine racemase